MPEPEHVTFTHRDIAELLVRKAGINEGFWGLLLQFGIAGANLQDPQGQVMPAAIVPVLKIGIQKFDQPSSLTVDASKLGPKRKSPRVKETKR
jgi:hypothetical protein